MDDYLGKGHHTIVCLSSQSWADKMWTNKQHIMSRLARRHRVIHADYGLRPLPLYLAKQIPHRPMDLLRPWRLLTDGVFQVGPSMYVSDSHSPLIAGAFPHGNRLRDFSTFDLKVLMIKQFLKREKIEDPIVWVYHPGFADAVDRLPRKLLVYDCVDNYAAFPTYRDNPGWLMEREARLCQKADLVFTTSEPLYESRRVHNPENTYLIHNVGDADHFKAALDPATVVPDDLLKIGGPVVGFVGAVSDYKLNKDWILALSKARPDVQIALIGPIGMADKGTDTAALEARPNVHLLGHRPYEALPSYLKGFDVAVIPYCINSYTESVFPIKFFEFLATGKPVVISNLPSLKPYYDTVEVAADTNAFVDACNRALGDDDAERQAARITLAESHSWPARIGAMMEKIESRL
jgi:glycosyltransferase involved in cell wall biosynthesis